MRRLIWIYAVCNGLLLSPMAVKELKVINTVGRNRLDRLVTSTTEPVPFVYSFVLIFTILMRNFSNYKSADRFKEYLLLTIFKETIFRISASRPSRCHVDSRTNISG